MKEQYIPYEELNKKTVVAEEIKEQPIPLEEKKKIDTYEAYGFYEDEIRGIEIPQIFR